MKKIVFVSALSLILTACTWSHSSGEKRYMQARNGIKVEVPAPLTDKNLSHFYDLPTPEKNTLVNVSPPS